MALTLVATPGSALSNSYLTEAEAQDYFDARSPVSAWDSADSQAALLVMATRVLDMSLASGRKLYVPGGGNPSYYLIRAHWTGAPTDGVQALAWPRTGMFNRNGFAIASNVIPQDLKNAVAELAGQLAVGDRTLDNDIAVQGITSVSAGSVSVSFKNEGIMTVKMLPEAVLFQLVPSWVTDELFEYAQHAEFEVL